MSEIYYNDKDYTNIKAKPVIKNEKKGEYNIIFEQFFIEKMFKGLYFNFKEINESFEVLRNIDNHCKAQVKKENGDIIDVQFNNDLDVLAVENMIESITY